MKVAYKPGSGAARQAAVHRQLGRTMGVGAAASEQMSPDVLEARKNRRVNARNASLSRKTAGYSTGGAGGSGFSDIQFATGRPRDPLFYWRQNNLPYDFSQNEELAKVRAFCRLLYQTDPINGNLGILT